MDQSNFFLPSREYYISSEKNVREGLKDILTKIVLLFGVEPVVANRDVHDVVDFEIELAKVWLYTPCVDIKLLSL